MLDLKLINKSWTLFLDRDGVINHEKYMDYVYNYDEFIFYDGVKEALKLLADKFDKILIVTNQRGIGKGLMTEDDLRVIHQKMLLDIENAGGRIDTIYYCTSLNDDCPNRKPNPGMALEASKDFPEIDLSRSIMVGNNISDMQFGKNAGMFTVYLKTTNSGQSIPHPLIDLSFDLLFDFAKALQ